MPKFYDELGEASLENLASDPSNLPEGRVWKNSTSQLPKVAIGGAVKELITNDATQTLSNKTISGASNTITNVSGLNVVNTPSGNLAATTSQAALNELQGDIDTINSSLSGHTSATTSVHGIADTADLLTTTNAKVVTNKDIDGATASNTNRITIPKDTTANIAALTRKAATLLYDTTLGRFFGDNGTTLNKIAEVPIALATEVSGALLETNGGTNQTTYTTGDILYASASNTLSKLPVGTAGQILKVQSGIPSWQTGGAVTTTAWTSYTPTFSGFGTVTNISMRYKRIDDTLYVQGLFQAGTVTGAAASLTIPATLTIDQTKTGDTAINAALQGTFGTTNNASQGFASANRMGGIFITSDTTNVYFVTTVSSNAFDIKAGTDLMADNQYVSVKFDVPISGW